MPTTYRARCPATIADQLLALSWWDWRTTGSAALMDFRTLPAEAFLDRYEG